MVDKIKNIKSILNHWTSEIVHKALFLVRDGLSQHSIVSDLWLA